MPQIDIRPFQGQLSRPGGYCAPRMVQNIFFVHTREGRSTVIWLVLPTLSGTSMSMWTSMRLLGHHVLRSMLSIAAWNEMCLRLLTGLGRGSADRYAPYRGSRLSSRGSAAQDATENRRRKERRYLKAWPNVLMSLSGSYSFLRHVSNWLERPEVEDALQATDSETTLPLLSWR